MRRILRAAVLALLAAVLLAAPSAAQTVLAGQTPGGAFYTIVVPSQWNGDLVIWNHGFSLTPGGPAPDLGPLQDLHLAEGYAVAASSYRQVGWAVFDSTEDLEQLYEVFTSSVGAPNQVLVYGASLGGIVTGRVIEEGNIGNVVGAFPFCGAMAGSRNWDAGLDLRVLYDAICQDVPGAFIPGGAKGLSLGALAAALTPVDTALAINACFAHDLPPSLRTPAQQARLDQFLAVSQLPESFINTTLGFFATFGMADLVHDPDKLGGRIGSGNANVDYGDADINASIQRVKPRQAKSDLLSQNYTPSGAVGNVKIVSLHTDKDGLVIVENESEYASVVPPGNLMVAIVEEAFPTHCGFSPAELVAGWETLRVWLLGNVKPDPGYIQFMCQALAPGLGGGPCRFNPFYFVPDMDGRIRPRNGGQALRSNSAKSSLVAPPQSAPPSPSGEAAPNLPREVPPQSGPSASVEVAPRLRRHERPESK